MSSLISEILAVSPAIRYVATYLGGELTSEERSGLDDASASESDKYEELIVNPTLLKLVTQRGDIDCGGAEWLVVRYGSFYELVMPVAAGHLSIGIELSADPVSIAKLIAGLDSVASIRIRQEFDD